MNKTFTILIAMLFMGLFVQAQCPGLTTEQIYSFEYSGHYYEIIKKTYSWQEACACAVSKGGYLTAIESSVEQTAIWQAITSTESGVSLTYTQVTDGGSIAYIWIGASDLTGEGSWKWDGDNDGEGTTFYEGQGANGTGDGSPIDDRYNNWGGTYSGTNNEPDNYVNIQDAGAIGLATWPSGGGTFVLGTAGEWNDIAPSNSIYSIIEYDDNPNSLMNMNSNSYIPPYFSPSDNKIMVDASAVHYNLYDITGRQIASGSITNKSVSAKQLNGVYLIELNDRESKVRIHKVYIY